MLALALTAAMSLAAVGCRSDEAARDTRPPDSSTVAARESAAVERHGEPDATDGAAGMLKRAEAALLRADGMGEVTVVWQSDGVLELRGTVTNPADRDRAEQLMRGVPGMRGVTNNLTVGR